MIRCCQPIHNCPLLHAIRSLSSLIEFFYQRILTFVFDCFFVLVFYVFQIILVDGNFLNSSIVISYFLKTVACTAEFGKQFNISWLRT